MLSEKIKKPFEDIARKKGHPIHWDGLEISREVSGKLHLDLNMINASLRAAVELLENESDTASNPDQSEARSLVLTSLKKLEAEGDAVDKVQFVMGSGTYYFREDLEQMIASANEGMHRTSTACESFCYIVTYPLCRCVCLTMAHVDCEQYCEERSRNVCKTICS